MWQSCLHGSRQMLVRNDHTLGGKWFFALAGCGVSYRFGWPSRSVSINGEAYFEMERSVIVNEAPLLLVCGMSEWRAEGRHAVELLGRC